MKTMKNLEYWRKKIDVIDIEIVKLINQRSKAVCKISILKTQANLPIIDLEREKEILQNVCQANNSDFENDLIIKIFQKIIQELHKLQFQAQRDYLEQRHNGK